MLLERILSRQLAPGQRLDVDEIADQLGVSRTPLKDALTRLSAEGLIEIRPRSGTYVTNPSIEDIEELFDVRRVLELYAAELAVRHITEPELKQGREIVRKLQKLVNERNWSDIYQDHIDLDHSLHRLIVEGSRNKQLKDLWEQVNTHVQIARVRYRRSESRLDLSMKEHEEILAALEARDRKALQEALRQNIDRGKQSLRDDWELMNGV